MGKGGSTTSANIPKELKPLYTQTGTQMMNLQKLSPVSGFTGYNPRDIAGLSAAQRAASQQVYDIGGRPAGETAAFEAADLAQKTAGLSANDLMVNGRNVLDYFNTGMSGVNVPTDYRVGKASLRVDPNAVLSSPVMKMREDYFDRNIAPYLQNKAALMGLGRSTSAINAMGNSRADMINQAFDTELSREERALQAIAGRETGAIESQLGRQTEAGRLGFQAQEAAAARQNQLANLLYGGEQERIGRQTGAYLSSLPALAGLGGAETARNIAQSEALQKVGGMERGVAQDTLNAQYEDFLRRQGLSEQALFAPFSQLPSTFGQTTKTSGGGLFK